MEERINHVDDQNARRLEDATRRLEDAIKSENIVNTICSDKEAIAHLNNRLSCTPVVWGDKKRLHVSDRAAVHTALFNLNSGEITIGEYSFTGSNVSFLTGSHDMNLTGLLRRDCEIKEGNDIIVGNGVWIASDATILGPCEIGDNAVVAAGAVVVPGTFIKENEVYGGVPAKKIAQINTKEMSIDNENVLKALERENGVLFLDGWSEKMIVEDEGKIYLGHTLLSDSAKIITDKQELELFYEVKADDPEILLDINEENYKISKKKGFITIDSNGTIEITQRNEIKKRIFFGTLLSQTDGKEDQ